MNYRNQMAFAGLSAVALAKADDKGSSPAPADLAADQADPEGVRQRRGIMPKQFLPGDGVDWIMKNVVAQGKGTRANLGRIFGISTGYEERTNTLPDGKVVTSIALKGAFQTEGYLTGELGEGTLAFLPAAYSEKVKAIFDANAIRDQEGNVVGNNVRMVEVDVDVGVEATGKGIPYEWVITAFREGEEMATLRKMRQSRKRPAYVLQTSAAAVPAIPRPEARPLAMLEAPGAAQEAVQAPAGAEVAQEA